MKDIEPQRNADDKELLDVSTLLNRIHVPVILKFEDLEYKVQLLQSEGLICRKTIKSEEKEILKGITGIVEPGKILAMLGPSGSGKTTVLKALGGRLTEPELNGRITYNDKPFSNSVKRKIGFVAQEDVLYPHLTVKETLTFTALLRLPNDLTKEEKVTHVETIITQLGLGKCRNTIVGGPLVRGGISGGEKKRVCIGQEMLTNPSLLFLDEPTSGLDSTRAQRIVSLLWGLATKGNRTIVMSIHQPSSRIFYMCDKVLLLCEGNSLYFGKGCEVMSYFETIGFAPSVAMNPSDFLLDLANGVLQETNSIQDQATMKQTLVTFYKQNLYNKLKAEMQQNDVNCHDIEEDGVNDKLHEATWTTTWWQQVVVLCERGVKERKHEMFSYARICQVVIISFISGLLWWQSDISHIKDQIGLLFFMSSFWGFYPLMQAIFTFPKERQILTKERKSGMYRLSSYFMSRMIIDLPMELTLPTTFVTITYWMAGLKPTASNFFHTLFVLLFNVLVAQSLGLALGALVMDQRSATIIGSVLMQTFLMAGGYYVEHVPSFVAWVKYVSISQYTYKLLLGSQFRVSETYQCGDCVCRVGDFPSIKLVGLERQGVSFLALGIMLFAYRFVAYFALMRIGATKK